MMASLIILSSVSRNNSPLRFWDSTHDVSKHVLLSRWDIRGVSADVQPRQTLAAPFLEHVALNSEFSLINNSTYSTRYTYIIYNTALSIASPRREQGDRPHTLLHGRSTWLCTSSTPRPIRSEQRSPCTDEYSN